MKIKGYAHSVIGSREMNQDSFLCEPDRGLFAVADGVGGGMKGDVASRMAVATLKAAQVSHGNLQAVVEAAQNAIYKESMETLGDALMGTTLTSLIVLEGRATLCHVGDSRCYLYSNEHLQQKTTDHEIYEESMQSTVLASYLGMPTEVHPMQIQCESFPLQPGERLLLCSDGLYRQLSEAQIVAFIKQNSGDPRALVEKLCEQAATAGYSDNVTVLYIEID